MIKSAERVEGKQGKRTAPGVRPHPDLVCRWLSPITSEVVGVSPSAEAQHLRSEGTQETAGLSGPPTPDLATKHHQSGPPHVPSELWVCPLFAPWCLQQRSSVGLVVPSRRIGETIVVSMAHGAPLNRRRPSTTGRRSISCTLTFTVTRPPASRQTLAAALSRANPWRP